MPTYCIGRVPFVSSVVVNLPNYPGTLPLSCYLSDRGVRRDTCMVGGKAAAEAGAVTHGAVRCRAQALRPFGQDSWMGGIRNVRNDGGCRFRGAMIGHAERGRSGKPGAHSQENQPATGSFERDKDAAGTE